MNLQEQIKIQKETLEEKRKEFYYVDYCNGCKVDFLNKYNIPCHHPWYCWQEDKTGELQKEIVELEIKKNPTAYDKNRLKELRNKRYYLIHEELKKWRKNL